MRAALIAAVMLLGLASAPLARAEGAHGYPPTVRATAIEAAEWGGFSEHVWSREWTYVQGRDDAAEVGYLPLSFFADAGGVGPFPVDYGYGGGGGFAFVGGSAGAFAGARASASASASVSIRGHGGFHHGGHGCGCR